MYGGVPRAQQVPQSVSGGIIRLLVVSSKLAWNVDNCVNAPQIILYQVIQLEWYDQNAVEDKILDLNSKYRFQLTDFSLPELQVLSCQGLPGIVDVEQLHEITGDRVGKLIYELGRPFDRPVASFAGHQTWKTKPIYTYSEFSWILFSAIVWRQIYKINTKWYWWYLSGEAGKMTVHLTRGDAPMSSWDFLTLFTLTCSAAYLSSQQSDSAPDTPADFFFKELGRFLQLNKSCNLTHHNCNWPHQWSIHLAKMINSAIHNRLRAVQLHLSAAVQWRPQKPSGQSCLFSGSLGVLFWLGSFHVYPNLGTVIVEFGQNVGCTPVLNTCIFTKAPKRGGRYYTRLLLFCVAKNGQERTPGRCSQNQIRSIEKFPLPSSG